MVNALKNNPTVALRFQLGREIERIETYVLPIVMDLGRAANLTYTLIEGDVRLGKRIMKLGSTEDMRNCLSEMQMVMPSICPKGAIVANDTHEPRQSIMATVKDRAGVLIFDLACRVFL